MVTTHYTENFRKRLLDSMPALMVLAVPLRMFLVAGEVDPEGYRGESPQRLEFKEDLQELRLKKLFVKGICHETDCEENCTCNVWSCDRCEETLTSSNLIDMYGLEYLEDVTFEGVSLDSSAYYNVVNENIRTMRLCLDGRNSYPSLGCLIQGCKRLERFEIDSITLDLRSVQFWAGLLKGVNLKLSDLCRGGFVSQENAENSAGPTRKRRIG